LILAIWEKNSESKMSRWGVRVFEKIPTQRPTDSGCFKNLEEELPGSVGERSGSYVSGYLTLFLGVKSLRTTGV
jgi:hypothetical protein